MWRLNIVFRLPDLNSEFETTTWKTPPRLLLLWKSSLKDTLRVKPVLYMISVKRREKLTKPLLFRCWNKSSWTCVSDGCMPNSLSLGTTVSKTCGCISRSTADLQGRWSRINQPLKLRHQGAKDSPATGKSWPSCIFLSSIHLLQSIIFSWHSPWGTHACISAAVLLSGKRVPVA